MSAAKHTPGPWYVWQPTRRSLPHIRSESGLYVMDAPPRREGAHGQVRQDADARLIAAAPEMLEALRKLVDCDLAYSSGCVDRGVIRIQDVQSARAAIKKATGDAS